MKNISLIFIIPKNSETVYCSYTYVIVWKSPPPITKLEVINSNISWSYPNLAGYSLGSYRVALTPNYTQEGEHSVVESFITGMLQQFSDIKRQTI